MHQQEAYHWLPKNEGRRQGRTKERDYKGAKDMLHSPGEGYSHYLDCGEGFISIYICQSLQAIYFKYVQLIVNYISIKLLMY